MAVGRMAGFGQESPSLLFSYAEKPRRPGCCEKTPREREECVWPPSPVSTQVYRSRRLRERRGLLCGSAAVRLLPVSSLWSSPNTPPVPNTPDASAHEHTAAKCSAPGAAGPGFPPSQGGQGWLVQGTLGDLAQDPVSASPSVSGSKFSCIVVVIAVVRECAGVST